MRAPAKHIHTNPSSRRLAPASWFLAGALFWAGVDLFHVAAATGGQALGRLVLLVVALYLGASAAWLAALRTRLEHDVTAFVAAALVPGALIALAYLNFVHLPDFMSPLTLAANATLLLAGAALCMLATRIPAIARASASRLGPLIAIVAGVAMAATAARGWSSSTAHQITATAAVDRPSVFVISIDSLRADRIDVGVSSTTPTLRDLALRGMRFTRAYSHASWTKPSVASLFTSRFPSSHGANLRRDRLSSQATTIAEIFATAGYRTGVFSANPWISPAFGFEPGVIHFVESEKETFGRLVLLLRVLRAVDRPLPGRPISRALATAEHAAGLGRDRRSNCERDEGLVHAFDAWLGEDSGTPAFAYFHLMSPHIPYDPPSGDRGFDHSEQVELLMRTDALPADRQATLVALYDETVAHADAMLAGALAVLERRGLLERSIVLVTADHGEEFFEHGRFGHGKTLFDEVTHVPWVMAGPGVRAGEVRDVPVAHIDIAPTLASLAGLAPSPDWIGRDATRADGNGMVYAELLREGGVEITMVTDGKRKLVESIDAMGAQAREEVYDLRADPGEQRPSIPERDDPLRAELARLRDAARASALAREDTAIDDDSEERLRALGYIN